MKPRLISLVIVIMASLFFLDRFLAGLEHAEVVNQARSFYAQGEALLSSGRAADAVPALQRAYALAREDRQYQLALAQALFSAGRLNEAESLLRQLLDRDSNDGPSNLLMARLEARSGDNQQAEAYYHRAVYGTWPSPERAYQVRMELAAYLANNGDQRQLLSELLVLEDSAPKDSAMQEKIAGLFLKAGSPPRAADAYRLIIQKHPDETAAYLGLADAELAQGDFRLTEASLRNALRERPDDQSIEDKLDFVRTLRDLDPTPRNLTSKEKLDRSLGLLDMVKTDLAECAESRHQTDRAEALLESAERMEKLKKPATNELAESVLSLAEQLWQMRKEVCGAPSPNSPLPALMLKVVQ